MFVAAVERSVCRGRSLCALSSFHADPGEAAGVSRARIPAASWLSSP